MGFGNLSVVLEKIGCKPISKGNKVQVLQRCRRSRVWFGMCSWTECSAFYFCQSNWMYVLLLQFCCFKHVSCKWVSKWVCLIQCNVTMVLVTFKNKDYHSCTLCLVFNNQVEFCSNQWHYGWQFIGIDGHEVFAFSKPFLWKKYIAVFSNFVTNIFYGVVVLCLIFCLWPWPSDFEGVNMSEPLLWSIYHVYSRMIKFYDHDHLMVGYICTGVFGLILP